MIANSLADGWAKPAPSSHPAASPHSSPISYTSSRHSDCWCYKSLCPPWKTAKKPTLGDDGRVEKMSSGPLMTLARKWEIGGVASS